MPPLATFVLVLVLSEAVLVIENPAIFIDGSVLVSALRPPSGASFEHEHEHDYE